MLLLEQYLTLRPPHECKWVYVSAVTPDLCCPLFPEPDAAPVDQGLLNPNKVILHQTRWILSQSQ